MLISDETQANNQPIIDRLPVSVFRLDRKYRILFANRWICDQLGVNADDVIGRTCPELGMAAETARAWRAALEETFVLGRPGRFEHLSKHPHERLVEYRFTPEWFEDEQGSRVVSALVAAFTIEEVRQLRAALKESEELLRAFLDRAPAIAWMRDAEGRYVFLNQTYLKHYNLNPEDRLGKKPEDVWPAATAAQFRQNDEAVLASGLAHRFLESAPEEIGVREWLNVKFPFTGSDGTKFIGGIGVDVTDQRAADAQLANAARVESLGILAAGAAHDFNNMLTVMIGHTDLARLTLPKDSPALAHLEQVQEAGERAAELCRQMLAFAGRSPNSPDRVDLSSLVRDTTRLAKPVLTSEVLLHVPDFQVLVRADPTNLRQVVLNLLTNANEAMADRPGQIIITLTSDSVDSFVVLTVADQGCGMSAAVQSRIFDPFFTTKPTGRGLGLAAVRGIIRSLGGEIAVESQLGIGTTFHVRLPPA